MIQLIHLEQVLLSFDFYPLSWNVHLYLLLLLDTWTFQKKNQNKKSFHQEFLRVFWHLVLISLIH